jgi:benzoate/toluate 1,2-dioxygenase subunit alpha
LPRTRAADLHEDTRMKIEDTRFDPSALDRLLVNDPDTGEFLLHRDVFRDPAIFELEMKYIFERNWVYLAHESQLPHPHDFYSTFIGRTPVIVWRDGAGKVGVYVNTCAHKGARVCHHQSGNAKHFVCGYHGWTYDSTGANVLVKDREAGAYGPGFDRLDHGLPKVRTGVYRGFIFGSLSDEVPSLDEHLGPIKPLMDLIADQGPDGVEMLPGMSSYTYRGNWKWQIENCVDGYHLTSAHPSFMNIVGRRKAGESANRQVRSMDIQVLMQAKGGTWTFPRGHAIGWGENPTAFERPLWLSKEELERRVGALRADWMLRLRNLTVFPNVQFAENASLQCRIIRPLAVDLTEMTIFCVGVKGESEAARAMRLRQYEDFFNTSGLATPDDTIAYEDCQAGLAAPVVEWQQGYARGAACGLGEGIEQARALGVAPTGGGYGTAMLQDETVFHGYLGAWKEMLEQGLARDAEATR